MARIKLTIGMLEVMHSALSEVLASEGFQGVPENSDEQQKMLDDAARSQTWIEQEISRRCNRPA